MKRWEFNRLEKHSKTYCTAARVVFEDYKKKEAKLGLGVLEQTNSKTTKDFLSPVHFGNKHKININTQCAKRWSEKTATKETPVIVIGLFLLTTKLNLALFVDIHKETNVSLFLIPLLKLGLFANHVTNTVFWKITLYCHWLKFLRNNSLHRPQKQLKNKLFNIIFYGTFFRFPGDLWTSNAHPPPLNFIEN